MATPSGKKAAPPPPLPPPAPPLVAPTGAKLDELLQNLNDANTRYAAHKDELQELAVKVTEAAEKYRTAVGLHAAQALRMADAIDDAPDSR